MPIRGLGFIGGQYRSLSPDGHGPAEARVRRGGEGSRIALASWSLGKRPPEVTP